MTKIKICGITNKIDAIAAARLGVDMLGFVFYKKSKRYVEPMTVEDIANGLPPSIARVGVFVDEDKDKVIDTAQNSSLDMLQFHGNETPEYCSYFREKYGVIKAFRLTGKEDLEKVNDYDVDFYLFDTYNSAFAGGTGEAFDWKILQNFEVLKPVILSGGLNAGNVEKAIAEILPYGVDVSTGVERSPGLKDEKLMKAFVEKVRKIY